MSIWRSEEKLAAVIEEAQANDPKELKRQVSTLTKQLQERDRQLATRQVAAVSPEPQVERVEVPVISDEVMENLRVLFEDVKTYTGRLEACKWAFEKGMEKTLNQLESLKAGEAAAHSRRARVETRRPAPPPSQSERKREPAAVGDFKLSATQQRVLNAIAFFESIGNPEPTNLQVGAVALLDSTGGHFSNTVGPLSSSGLVVRGDGRMRLTDPGRALAKVPERIATLDDYHDVLRERVLKVRSAGRRTVDILNVIIGNGGAEVTNEYIGRQVGIDHTGGHYSNTIGPLSTLGLITRSGGVVRPTEILFPEGLD